MILKPVFIYGDAPFDNSSMIRKILEKMYCDQKNIPYTLSPLAQNGNLDVLLDPGIDKDYMRYEYFGEMFVRLLEEDNGWGSDFIISKDYPEHFAQTIHHIQEAADGNVLTHVNILSEGDYLQRHNGISKNFYKLCSDYELPLEAFDNALGIQKTWNSIVKHYENNL